MFAGTEWRKRRMMDLQYQGTRIYCPRGRSTGPFRVVAKLHHQNSNKTERLIELWSLCVLIGTDQHGSPPALYIAVGLLEEGLEKNRPGYSTFVLCVGA